MKKSLLNSVMVSSMASLGMASPVPTLESSSGVSKALFPKKGNRLTSTILSTKHINSGFNINDVNHGTVGVLSHNANTGFGVRKPKTAESQLEKRRKNSEARRSKKANRSK